jgi:hypothetical protein
MTLLARLGQWLLQGLGAVAVAGGVGLGVGWLGSWAHVALLGPLVVGLSAGAAASFFGLWLGSSPRSREVVAALAVLAGILGLQVAEDWQFRGAFAEDLGMARYTGDGGLDRPPPAELLARATDAEELLEAQVVADAGIGGPLGRSLFRAAAGIRLFGAIRQSWFLAVGRLGGVAFALAELGLALWLGRRVLARLRPT